MNDGIKQDTLQTGTVVDNLKKLCHMKVSDRGGKAFMTKDGKVILYHIATRNAKGQYWFGICLDNFIKYVENLYPNAEQFVAFELRIEKFAEPHAVLIIPVADFLELYSEIKPDTIDNKWHVLINEYGITGIAKKYTLYFGKYKEVDITEYLNPFDRFSAAINIKTDNQSLLELPIEEVPKDETSKRPGCVADEVGTLILNEQITLVANSCIENQRNAKKFKDIIEKRKEAILSIQDKIDGLKKELDIEKTNLSDDERKLNICVQEYTKNEEQLVKMIKDYLKEQVDKS